MQSIIGLFIIFVLLVALCIQQHKYKRRIRMDAELRTDADDAREVGYYFAIFVIDYELAHWDGANWLSIDTMIPYSCWEVKAVNEKQIRNVKG